MSGLQIHIYKSRGAYERDAKHMASKGWIVQSVATTTSRRMLGCLFGIIGYWLLPRRTVYHVTYVPAPPPVPVIPAIPEGVAVEPPAAPRF